ncbi:MAG: dihydrodipicolinate synthase family protein [Clostridia bacterium]|nr:dihydrodipicolinate synthase family protein [Clostridia bacterium]
MEIKGLIPAMATPMREDGSLNLDAIAPLADRLIESGADGLFVAGSMGEAASLSLEERLSAVKATVKAVNGRVPVLAGTGFPTTEETIRMTRMCENEGVAAVSVITPYYWKMSQDALYRHYASVISATTLPVFAYNLPQNTGNNLDPETVGRLYRQEGLAGAKDSCAKWENTKGYMDQTDSGFCMLEGEDSLCLEGLKYGSRGSISAPSNVCTHVMAAIYDRFTAGDIEGAQKAQEDWNRITAYLGTTGAFPGSYKLATSLLTSEVGPARLPVLPADMDKMQAVLPLVKEIAERYI